MAPNDQAWPTPSSTDFPDLSDVEIIARGAHAAVYRAYQVSASRHVALKIDNRVLSGDSAERDRFEQELRAIGQLSEHPNIIDTYIAGLTSRGNPYVVTELCKGSFADRVSSQGPLTPEEAQRVGIRIADALATAHDNRVLHRDIKPANLLIDSKGFPVLADFGAASLRDARNEEPVVRAAMTPAYAPLETFHLRPSGEPGDVYSLAATLYALMCGHPPRFPTDDRDFSIQDVIGLFTEPITDIPGVSHVMLGMLRAAMTNNPEGRPSAIQFRDMLESVPMAAATGALPVQRPSEPPQPAAPPMSSPPVASPPMSSPPRTPSPAPEPELPARMPEHATPPREGRRPSPVPRPRHATWGQPDPSTSESTMDMPAVGRDTDDNLPVLAPKSELSTRRERRIAARGGKESGGMGSLILVGGIAVAVIIAAAVGTILFISGGDDAPAGKGGGGQKCALTDYDLSCMNEPVCYNGDLVHQGSDLAAAKEVSCGSKHRWEAYGKGDLPSAVSKPTYGQIETADVVKESCLDNSPKGPLQHLLGVGGSDWRSDVLPPSKTDFDKGNHSFYCVATRKDGKETSQSAFK